MFARRLPDDQLRLPRHWNHPLAPISFAGYFVGVAVAFGPFTQLLHGELHTPLAYAGLAGEVSVLLLFWLRAWLHERPGGSAPWSRLAVMLQVPAALLASVAFTDGIQPALLIPAIVQVVIAFRWPVALAIVVTADIALAFIMRSYPSIENAIVTFTALYVGYLGFQAFAVITATYARRAEEARDQAVRLNAELSATRQLLRESARGEERLRLSRELHDVAGHKLTALKLQLTLAERRGNPSGAVFSEARQLADELLADIRGIVSALRQDDGIDLRQALQVLTEAMPYLPVELDAESAPRVTGVEQAQALLRCAQEGLTNVLRHSAATRAALRLRLDDGWLRLSVEDNGQGRRGAAPGNGLTGLRERLSALGGTLQMEDAPGGGTRLRASLPAA